MQDYWPFHRIALSCIPSSLFFFFFLVCSYVCVVFIVFLFCCCSNFAGHKRQARAHVIPVAKRSVQSFEECDMNAVRSARNTIFFFLVRVHVLFFLSSLFSLSFGARMCGVCCITNYWKKSC